MARFLSGWGGGICPAGICPRTQPFPVPNGPLVRLHMDISRISTASHVARYSLVITCAFSKYVIARPLKRKTSETVEKLFFQTYIQVCGLPIELTISQDNGGEFRDYLIKHYSNSWVLIAY